jgi:multidrug resistance efflux pump
LIDRSGRSLGGVVFAREQAWTPVDEALFAELARVWSHALAAFAPRASWLERAKLTFSAGKYRRRALAAIACALVLPVPLTVLAPAEVTAKDPFVVRAPLDGVIDRLFAQPNQRVAAGAPLFALDSTALASRYALANKNYATAQEEYRQTAQLAVTDDKDRLDMALRKGKLDESAIELDYTARELARVRVNAPRAGVAVFSDPNDWNGKAVSIGEKVMLLADPASVELTAYVPVADNVDVVPGATLTLYPKSSPLAAYDARIDTVAYRAEPTPEGVVAYRVKATFEGAVKPPLGVMGTARIHGRWVPLAYYLLRRPLATARQWLGW